MDKLKAITELMKVAEGCATGMGKTDKVNPSQETSCIKVMNMSLDYAEKIFEEYLKEEKHPWKKLKFLDQ